MPLALPSTPATSRQIAVQGVLIPRLINASNQSLSYVLVVISLMALLACKLQSVQQVAVTALLLISAMAVAMFVLQLPYWIQRPMFVIRQLHVVRES